VKVDSFKVFLISALVLILILISCNQSYTPRPKGYIRIDFPDKKYINFKGKLPYSFEYPLYGLIKPDSDKNAEPYWINIEFPQYKGKIHISYKKVKGNLANYIEDTRKMAYKHTIKADAIDEVLIKNDSNKVFGIIYDIKGNAASSMQFFATDSINNFIRGALYFSSQPNKDSLAPVIDFFTKDVEHFIKTLKWKK
jgi:gliding motility-associated lipoprotein GldD